MFKQILLKKFEHKKEVYIVISYIIHKNLDIEQIDYIIFCTKFFEKFNGLEISFITRFVKTLNKSEIDIQQECIYKKTELMKEDLYTKLF